LLCTTVVGLDVCLSHECSVEGELRAVCGPLQRELRSIIRIQQRVCGEIKGSTGKRDGERGATGGRRNVLEGYRRILCAESGASGSVEEIHLRSVVPCDAKCFFEKLVCAKRKPNVLIP
jgi:hypothetical protein